MWREICHCVELVSSLEIYDKLKEVFFTRFFNLFTKNFFTNALTFKINAKELNGPQQEKTGLRGLRFWEQQRRRPACGSVQTVQPLFIHLLESIITTLVLKRNLAFLASLCS